MTHPNEMDEAIASDGPVLVEPSEEDRLREIVHRQEIAIAVMRDRIGELEMELINTRCEMLDHRHG
jgi:hypothetical protein